MERNNKQLTLTIVAVVTLIALVAGATYAYFAVGVTNNFGTTNINATAESVGSVALNAGSDLSLSVSAADMMARFNDETPVDVEYYATVGTTNPNHTNDSTPVTIGSATVTGNGTFNCNYTLRVTPSYTGSSSSSSMLQQLGGMSNHTTGQLILYVNGQAYDLYTLVHNENLSDVTGNVVSYDIPGTFTAISESTNSGSNANLITAQLKLVNLGGEDGNSTANSQNALAGTNVNLSISVVENSLSCTAVTTVSQQNQQQEESIPEGIYLVTNYENKVKEGLELPDIPMYNSGTYNDAPTRAMNDWRTVIGEDSTKPYFLRFTLGTGTTSGLSNVPVEAYVGFVVTEEMVASNPEMVAGTYYIRGWVDETDLDNKAIYDANVNTMKIAFGYNSGYSSRCHVEASSDFRCMVTGLTVHVNMLGNVDVDDGSTSCRANIGGSGGDASCGLE